MLRRAWHGIASRPGQREVILPAAATIFRTGPWHSRLPPRPIGLEFDRVRLKPATVPPLTLQPDNAPVPAGSQPEHAASPYDLDTNAILARSKPAPDPAAPVAIDSRPQPTRLHSLVARQPAACGLRSRLPDNVSVAAAKTAVQQCLGVIWLLGKQVIKSYQRLVISFQTHQGSRAIQQGGWRCGIGCQCCFSRTRQRLRRASQRPKHG